MRLYIVSTCLWKIWWPTWCHMFNVSHRNDFVTQKVSRHRSFSVWTRAWTRLVVDTLRGNMSVEPKHMKLWDKLYTDTSSHEKICMRTRPCKSKSCAQGRFFYLEYTSQSFPWVKPMTSDMISYVKSCIHTRPPMWKIAHCHVSQLRRIRRSNGKLSSKLHTDMGLSLIHISEPTRPY